MFNYDPSKRGDFKNCQSIILLSALEHFAQTLPNRGGWIEIQQSKLVEMFGLSSTEFRGAQKELLEKGMIERNKFGKFPFLRVANSASISEEQHQISREGTLDINNIYNTKEDLNSKIFLEDINNNNTNIMSLLPQNEAEPPKSFLSAQQKHLTLIGSERLEEFSEWWGRWRQAHQKLPEKNDCRKRSLAGLRNSSRAKAEKAYLKLREKFERSEIFLATRYYLINKRNSLQQTAHAERFLSEQLISQFLYQVREETEEAAASEHATIEALNLNVGVYGT